MLNPKLKLNPKLFSENCESESMRVGFGNGLVRAGERNQNVVALCADLTESLNMHKFKAKFKDRFIQVGIAEQNMVGIASGLASVGKIPFCGSFAIFSPGRNWEQIRTTIAYNDSKVVIVGSHAGVSVGEDGGSHQALEDIALMQTLPNMNVFSPCDSIEAKKITEFLGENKSYLPAYLRLARLNVKQITEEETPFEIGKAELFYVPDVGLAEVGIISTGELTYEAMLAALELNNEGIKVKVLNLSSIVPIDKEAIISLAKETKRIITVENHQIRGGMGSIVSQILGENYPVTIHFIGVKNKFGQSGKREELLSHYELDKEAIKKAVYKILKK